MEITVNFYINQIYKLGTENREQMFGDQTRQLNS
ncbi:MAG: hypothetical protein RI928_1062 [Pseudomonadota bacterium]|jgi:hypothetical protein